MRRRCATSRKTPTFGFDDGAPVGGFDRDGRAVSLAEQAQRPFLAAHEMANTAAADVSDKLSRATYAADFKAMFGNDVFDQPEVAFDRALDRDRALRNRRSRTSLRSPASTTIFSPAERS